MTDTVFPATAGRERAEYMARKNRLTLTAGPWDIQANDQDRDDGEDAPPRL